MLKFILQKLTTNPTGVPLTIFFSTPFEEGFIPALLRDSIKIELLAKLNSKITSVNKSKIENKNASYWVLYKILIILVNAFLVVNIYVCRPLFHIPS